MFSGGLDAADVDATPLARTSPAGGVYTDTVVGETHWSVAASERQVRRVADSRVVAPGHSALTLSRRARYLMVIDLVCAAVAALVAHRLRPDGSAGSVLIVALPLAWVGVIAANRGYEKRFLGSGTSEFARVFCAFLQLTALATFGSYVIGAHRARELILIALPAMLLLDCLSRVAARCCLHSLRKRGRSTTPVLAIGSALQVAQLADLLDRDKQGGLRVVGACTSGADDDPVLAASELTDRGVALLGDVDSVVQSVRESGARTVAVLSGAVPAEKLRWISWQLEGTGVDIAVVPAFADIADRRLHIHQVAGLSLLHIDEPTFSGFARVVKSGVDKLLALCALVVLSPLLLLIAMLVRVSSAGPALFVQTRVGRNGRPFRMVKFRSMYSGSELRVVDLLSQNEAADGLLFKIREDPRITPAGRVLRKYSLDELPQLFNVLTGSMSLVGPRPALPSEVERYGADLHRRLLVKPGLTGLWQINGRSDLSWEESVRLDLHYVENWSLALDLLVLVKTARVVLSGSGAY